MKKWGRILLTICLTLCMGMAGIAYGAGEEERGPGNAYTKLTETYNRELGLYEEQFAGGRRFITNIPNGGQMYDAAYIALSGNMRGKLERDGVGISLSKDGYYYDPGYYILTIEAPSVGKDIYEAASFSFRLLGQPKGMADTGEYAHPKISCGTEVVGETGKDGWYRFHLPNYKSIFTTLPKDNSTVTAASFYIPGNVNYTLTRDAAAIQLINQVEISTPGQYALKVSAESYGINNPCPVYYETSINFTIPAPETELVAEAFSASAFGGSASGETKEENKRQLMVESLLENYYENAGLYEEGFSNGVVFYSNVAAGSITGGNVYLDIPANIQVSMTKDGSAAEFRNKVPMNEEGSYLLNLAVTDVVEGMTEIRTSTLRFRIQKGVAPALSPDEAGALSSLEESQPEQMVESDNEIQESTAETDVAGETDAFIPNQAESGMYDAKSERYRYSFTDGSSIDINVPRNAVVNGMVYATLPEGVKATITKDGSKSLDYQSELQVADHGTYLLTAENGAGEKLEFAFRILLHAVNDINQFTAPEGYLISSVDVNNEQAQTLNQESYDISEDGTYSFVMLGKSKDLPELFTVVIRDTQAPVLTFEGLDEKGEAVSKSFSYTCDDDQAVVSVQKGKKTIKMLGKTIKNSGTYILSAEDAAGNKNQYQARVPFHLNLVTMVLVILVVTIVGGMVAFYISNRDQMKVR